MINVQDVFYIEAVEQAMTLLNPHRIELLKRLDVPRTCPELADFFGESPQKVYYHVKALEKAGLVDKTSERRVRGVVEGTYQAKARSYWLAPHLVGQIGGHAIAEDQTSLRVLLSLAEDMHDDIGRLAHQSEAGQDVPSLSLSAHIQLPELNRRAEFLAEVQSVFRELAAKYGAPDDDIQLETDDQGFRLVLACYPKDVTTTKGQDS
jgi:DNA-binding transcriptional ArsR family regulator